MDSSVLVGEAYEVHLHSKFIRNKGKQIRARMSYRIHRPACIELLIHENNELIGIGMSYEIDFLPQCLQRANILNTNNANIHLANRLAIAGILVGEEEPPLESMIRRRPNEVDPCRQDNSIASYMNKEKLWER